ncbi:MAG: molybdenum cofactor guanylyltransferase [Flavobacteriaceae bacterium]
MLTKKEQKTPLKALILVGGKSTRMGSDKSQLHYHGKTQQEQTFNILNTHFKSHDIYYSVRDENQLKNASVIIDVIKDSGPLVALYSAFKYDKKTAWLTLAIDLPFVDDALLKLLISKRNPKKIATVFKGKNKNYPEPLITIWEPKVYEILKEKLDDNKLSLVKILQENDVEIITIEDELLQNINTLKDYQHIKNIKL